VVAFILDYWPATLFLPSVLLLIAALALITRWWDRRTRLPRRSRRCYEPSSPVEATAVDDDVGQEIGATSTASSAVRSRMPHWRSGLAA
jgi:hypothetical protein